ncbi:109_t:CDS:1, partial [Scutellospora calospora]
FWHRSLNNAKKYLEFDHQIILIDDLTDESLLSDNYDNSDDK